LAHNTNEETEKKKQTVSKSRNTIARTQDRKTCYDIKLSCGKDAKRNSNNTALDKYSYMYQTTVGKNEPKPNARHNENVKKPTATIITQKQNKAGPVLQSQVNKLRASVAKSIDCKNGLLQHKPSMNCERKGNVVQPLKPRNRIEYASRRVQVSSLMQQYSFGINK